MGRMKSDFHIERRYMLEKSDKAYLLVIKREHSQFSK
jgi:hypothetical protein